MKGAFWFALGAATAAYVIYTVHGYDRRLSPADVASALGRHAGPGAAKAAVWVEDFGREFVRARREKRSELMGLLTTKGTETR